MTQHAPDGTIAVPSPSITANTMSLWLRLFLAFGLFCLAGLGGLLGWQQHTFSDGFLNYLDSVSQKQAQRAALRLATEYTKTGSWKALRAEPGRMGRLVDDDTALQPASIPTESPANTPGDGAPRGAPGYGPPRVPPARGLSTSVALGMRLRLSDIDHRYVAGNTDPTPSRLPVVPVMVNGQQVGQLEISPLPPADGSLEAEFAAGQWRSIGVAGAVAAALSLLFAFGLARGVVRPVRALSLGTRALAGGDYSRQIAVTGNDEIASLAGDFNALAHALAQHREARRRWGQDLAHELRTPLTVIQAELQMLADGVRPISTQALQALLGECERLGGLIGDLNQLELADAAALEYRFVACDLGELLSERLAAHRGSLQAAGLALDVRGLDQSVTVRADPQRLAQLIDNLLSNAHRYTDAPGRVVVSLSQQDRQTELRVENSGPGVSDQDLPLLFDRLYRVEGSRNRAGGGSGLGLAICLAVARAHGAELEALHAELGGLSIRLRMPLWEGVG